MEFRKIFDTIPEEFDKYRPRYSKELFDNLIDYAKIGKGKSVLELGPGTGQATEPILNTGCDYHAIELGEHLFEKMKSKFGSRVNFDIVKRIINLYPDRVYKNIYNGGLMNELV